MDSENRASVTILVGDKYNKQAFCTQSVASAVEKKHGIGIENVSVLCFGALLFYVG